MKRIQFKLPEVSLKLSAAVMTGLLMSTSDVLAQATNNAATGRGGIAQVTRNLTEGTNGVLELIVWGAYLIGAFFGVQCLIGFKAHFDNPSQNKLTQPLGQAVVAGGLLSLPTFLGLLGETGFDNVNSQANLNLLSVNTELLN